MKTYQTKSHSVNDILSALEALDKRICSQRRAFPRKSADYRILTLEVGKVRDLMSFLEAKNESAH